MSRSLFSSNWYHWSSRDRLQTPVPFFSLYWTLWSAGFLDCPMLGSMVNRPRMRLFARRNHAGLFSYLLFQISFSLVICSLISMAHSWHLGFYNSRHLRKIHGIVFQVSGDCFKKMEGTRDTCPSILAFFPISSFLSSMQQSLFSGIHENVFRLLRVDSRGKEWGRYDMKKSLPILFGVLHSRFWSTCCPNQRTTKVNEVSR